MIEVPMTDEVLDFSSARKTLKFRVDDDLFEAPPDIAAELALRFADEAAQLDDDNGGPTSEQQVTVMRNLIRMILLPESAERFIARLSDAANPIGVETFERVVEHLLERYGLRPTESDSPSSSGSDSLGTGTSLRESPSDTGSNSATLATTASST